VNRPIIHSIQRNVVDSRTETGILKLLFLYLASHKSDYKKKNSPTAIKAKYLFSIQYIF
jgi:hypothetical protein